MIEFDELNAIEESSNSSVGNQYNEEIPCLISVDKQNPSSLEPKTSILLEIGCGVGNFMYPLLKQNNKMFVYACDFSTDAIDLLKANLDYDTSRCQGFVCDATKTNSFRECLPEGVKVDFVTLIFVLSAIHPKKMSIVVDNIAQVITYQYSNS